MRAQFLLAVALAGLSVTPAFAIKRYNSEKLACSEVRAIIRSEGAAIMRYRSTVNPSLTLYDRYVRHDGYCDPREYAAPATIPAKDTRSCPVRKCRERIFLFERFFDHPKPK